jgi:SEC-C motif-containing protein
MGSGARRNSPCWCGSGRKYKNCHYGRANDQPMTREEGIRAHRTAFGVKMCLHPEAPEGCKGGVIRAHTVSKKKDLASIEDGGHVYYFQPRPDGPSGDPVLTGVNKVSTFTGFCSHHDESTFRPIDRNPYDCSSEQTFLLAYRALSREFYGKLAMVNTLQGLQTADRGRSVREQIALQSFLDANLEGANRGLEDLRSQKERFDAALVTGDFSDIQHYAVMTDCVPSTLCSAGLLPEYDFQAALLQDLGQVGAAEGMFYSSTSTAEGGAFVFAWLVGQESPLRLVQSLRQLDVDDVPDALTRFVFEFTENVCIAPAWWDLRTPEEQEALVRRNRSGATPTVARTSDCLLDDGLRVASWSMTGECGTVV